MILFLSKSGVAAVGFSFFSVLENRRTTESAVGLKEAAKVALPDASGLTVTESEGEHAAQGGAIAVIRIHRTE